MRMNCKRTTRVKYKEVEGDILCNMKKHEPYLDINYEEWQNFNFFNQMKKKIMQNFQ